MFWGGISLSGDTVHMSTVHGWPPTQASKKKNQKACAIEPWTLRAPVRVRIREKSSNVLEGRRAGAVATPANLITYLNRPWGIGPRTRTSPEAYSGADSSRTASLGV